MVMRSQHLKNQIKYFHFIRIKNSIEKSFMNSNTKAKVLNMSSHLIISIVTNTKYTALQNYLSIFPRTSGANFCPTAGGKKSSEIKLGS